MRNVARKVRRLGGAASTAIGPALVLAVLMGASSVVFGANGGNFILGQGNSATILTRLGGAGGVDGAMLEVQNNNAGTDDTALSLKVQAGEAPMQVNSSTKVSGLNADLLDGLDSATFQRKYAQTVVVAKSGGAFASVQPALDSIADATAAKRYLVWIAPGTYTGRIQMKSFVDIQGSGQLSTKVTAPGGTDFGPGSAVVSGANDAELRQLTVKNTGGDTNAYGIFNGSASPRLSDLTATGQGGTHNRGVVNANASPTMDRVTATASGGDSAFGVDSSGGSSPTMIHVIATATGAGYNVGVVNAGSSATMTDVTATATGGVNARGVENSTSSPTMTNVIVTASGGSAENTGLYNYLHASPIVRSSRIAATGTASIGVWSTFPDDAISVVTIDNSEVTGATATIKAEGGYKVRVGASKLNGGEVSTSGAGTEVRCAGVHDEAYSFATGPGCP